MIHIEPKH